MTFFPEPIQPSKRKKENPCRVHRIEADRYQQEGCDEEGLEKKEYNKRWYLYGAFLIYFTTLLHRFDASQQIGEEISHHGLLGNLKELKSLLEIMRDLDQSNNSPFCHQLSKVWIALLQDVKILSITKRKVAIDLKQLFALMERIDHYPPNEDHNLGYYLSNYAGDVWLPIPFREIVNQLYSDHLLHQKMSVLTQWIDRIDALF